MNILVGDNSFMRRRRRQELIAEFVAAHGDLAIEAIDCQEASFEQIQAAIESAPFLAAKKLVVLDSPSTNKDFLDQYKELLDDVSERTELLIDEPKPDKRSSYYKFIKKQPGFQEFPELDSHGLARWAVDYAKENGAELSARDARDLVDRINPTQMQLANEIDKLALFDQHIDQNAIEELTARSPSSTIFALIESAFSSNKQRALGLYDEQRSLQVAPQQIIGMLSWQFHMLAIIKSAQNMSDKEIAAKAKISPFVVSKNRGLAQSLSIGELRSHIGMLRTIDQRSKQSRYNLDDALRAFILQL